MVRISEFTKLAVLLSASLVSFAAFGEEAVFESEFVEVRQTAFGLYGIFDVRNVSGKAIDDLRLDVFLKTEDGTVLTATAVTDATPGLAWVAAGESFQVELPLDRSADARQILETASDEAILSIDIKAITYLE